MDQRHFGEDTHGIYIGLLFPKGDGEDDISVEGGMEGGNGFDQPIMSQSDHLLQILPA
jgi:hypothetical protein